MILWKETNPDKVALSRISLITPQEWQTYYQRSLAIDTSFSKEKVSSDLEAARIAIQLNGGFE